MTEAFRDGRSIAQQAHELPQRRVVVAAVPAGDTADRRRAVSVGKLSINDTGVNDASAGGVEQGDGSAQGDQADDGVAVGAGLQNSRQDPRPIQIRDQGTVQLRTGVAAGKQDALVAKIVPCDGVL